VPRREYTILESEKLPAVFFLPLSRFSALQGLTPRNYGSRVVFDRDFFLLFQRANLRKLIAGERCSVRLLLCITLSKPRLMNNAVPPGIHVGAIAHMYLINFS